MVQRQIACRGITRNPATLTACISQIGQSFGMQPASSTRVQPDGSYRLVVCPGPGVVCLAASPGDSFAVAAVDDEELANLFSEEIKRGKGQRLPSAAEVRAGHTSWS